MGRRTSTAERFWPKVDKDGPIPSGREELGCCWIWTASSDRLGYGWIWDQQRVRKAHVVAYEAEHGPVPEGLELDHLCRTASCIRPSHLEAVSHRINLLRGGTVWARNAAKTHCPAGHAYDGIAGGRRCCRQCRRNYMKQYVRKERR